MAAKVLTLLALIQIVSSLTAAVNVPSLLLKNAAKSGMMMSATGLGTAGYGAPGEVWNDAVGEKAVGQWLSLGARRIDNANNYHDEVGIGKAIKASNISRSEIFLTSKLDNVGYNETFQQMDKILSDLQMDYVDLLLIHWPTAPRDSTDPACQGNRDTYRECRQSVWKAMEELYKSGKALAIGVSNFEKNHLDDIIAMNSLVPSVNQVEYHPYWHEDDLVEFCKSHDIVFNGYAPLGAPDFGPPERGWNGTILELPVIVNIAKAHNVSAAQVLLRWQWQQGIVVNPRSWNVDHMKENLNFFNFHLSDDEMKQISTIKPPDNPKVCPDPHNIK